MNNDYTDITLVVDRSGSMASTKEDAQGGINTLINEQASKPGKCTLTLVQFDSSYEVVYNGTDIKNVKPYELVPRGTTALLDAVGIAITTTGQRLAAMPEGDRPALVIFAIVTDGQENSSREYTKAKIKEMVSHQQDTYNWKFTFLGANQDAFAEGASLGFAADGISTYNTSKSFDAYANVSSKFARMRFSASAGQAVSNAFTDEEVKGMN